MGGLTCGRRRKIVARCFRGRATFVPARSDSLRFELAIYRRKLYRSLLSEAFGAGPLWASSHFPSAVGEDLDIESSPPS